MGKMIGGFVVAVIVGGGGAAALNVFARDLAPPPVMRAPSNLPDPDDVALVEVVGEVRALMPDGQWRHLRQGFSLQRPTGLDVIGPEARATIRFSGVTLSASLGAKVLIGAPGGTLGLQVERGRVVVTRTGRDISTHLPRHDTVVHGPSYGIWAHDDSVAVAVLGERAEIEHLGEEPVRYGRAREIVLNRTRAIPTVLDEKLEITVLDKNRRGRRYRFRARAARNAIIRHKRSDDAYDTIETDLSGSFSVELDNEEPADGELVAYDAAGRSAQIGRPSRSLASVLMALSDAENPTPANATREEAEALRDLGDRKAPPTRAAPPPPARAAPPPPRAAPPPPPPARAAPPPPVREAPKPTPAAKRVEAKATPPPVKLTPPPPPPKVRPKTPTIGEKPEAPAPKGPPVAKDVDVDLLDDPDDEIDEDDL